MSDPTPAPGASSRASKVSRIAALLVYGFVLWVSKVNVGVPLNEGRTDGSWCWLMIDAFLHGRQFGPDVVWTYGPLGGIHSGLWVPEVEPARMWLWEVGFKGLIAAFAVAATLRLRDNWSRVLFGLVYVLIPTEGNVWGMLAIVSVAMLLFDGLSRPWVQWLATFPLAVMALEKTTGLVLSSLVVAIACAALVFERERKSALRCAVSFAGWLSLMWLVCGQSLWNFPMWVSRSLEIAGGYSEAMSLDAVPETWIDGRVSIALAFALCVARLACGVRRARDAGVVAAWAAGMFVAYKAGFVRAADHPMIYFLAAPPLAYMLCTPEGARVWPARFLAGLRHAMALHAFWIGMLLLQPGALSLHTRIAQVSLQSTLSAAYVLHPEQLREEIAPQLTLARTKFELKRIKPYVGDATVDVVPCQHGVAVLNGLNLDVRPIIQSYATFTPHLAEINARFFESERAPRFVILELFSLDFRPTTLDDAAALQVLARDYQPILCDMDDVLLERVPPERRGRPLQRTTRLSRTLHFGDTVELAGLEGQAHVLALDVRYTLAGKLRTTLDQAPPLFIQVSLDDGRILRVRIVPGMARGGFIADPWIGLNSDWLQWRSGQAVARPVRIALEPPAAPWMYQSEVKFEYIEAADLVPDPRFARLVAPCDSMFDTAPLRVEPKTASHMVTFPDMRARAVDVPSSLVFSVPAGHLRLECLFGLMPRSYTKRDSDGARFSAVLVRDGVDLATVYERTLDPRQVESDRGHIRLDTWFDSDGLSELHLRVDGGPAGDTRDDWPYWGSVRISDGEGRIVPGSGPAAK